MTIKTISIFKADCDRKYCNRNTMITKKCVKEYKQDKCYTKYIKREQKELDKQNIKIEDGYILKNEKDIKWEEVCQQVDYRDCDCLIWNKVLTEEEKQFVKENFDYEMNFLKILDHCHIISRSEDKSLMYDMNNIFLAKRFFHQRFDQYKDLVTGQKMDKERRDWWKGRIENKIKGELK